MRLASSLVAYFGNPNRSAAIGQPEEQFDRGLVSGQQPLVGIGAGIGECGQRTAVGQNAADKTQRLSDRSA